VGSLFEIDDDLIFLFLSYFTLTLE